jgi:effector-binding domain-containing protein
MPPTNDYRVTLEKAAPRSIAAVRARVPASQVSAHFRTYLDQVYAAGRAGAVKLDGQNIFVYRDVSDAPAQLDVDFGVGITAPFTGVGNVIPAATPQGDAATTTHWGDYGALGGAHAAVVAWCREHDVSLAGPRWEVYGHWQEGVAPRTDVYYLIGSRR